MSLNYATGSILQKLGGTGEAEFLSDLVATESFQKAAV